MDKRLFIRVPIDIPCFALLSIAGREPVSAIVRDISRGGMQVGLPPEMFDPTCIMGLACHATNLPVALDTTQDGFFGNITWASATACGVRFEVPLTADDAILQRVAELL